jgi:hypothetical protein
MPSILVEALISNREECRLLTTSGYQDPSPNPSSGHPGHIRNQPHRLTARRPAFRGRASRRSRLQITRDFSCPWERSAAIIEAGRLS